MLVVVVVVVGWKIGERLDECSIDVNASLREDLDSSMMKMTMLLMLMLVLLLIHQSRIFDSLLVLNI